MSPEVAHRQYIEAQIINLIVIEAISKGYSVSVHDGEETTVEKSTDFDTITKATMTTDEDTLIIHDKSGERIGMVYLVYGNDGWDVIADYTLNDQINDILIPAEQFANNAENEAALDDFNYVGSRHHY